MAKIFILMIFRIECQNVWIKILLFLSSFQECINRKPSASIMKFPSPYFQEQWLVILKY